MFGENFKSVFIVIFEGCLVFVVFELFDLLQYILVNKRKFTFENRYFVSILRKLVPKVLATRQITIGAFIFIIYVLN